MALDTTDSVNLTQTERILRHLLEHSSITHVEAAAMYKSRSLTKRIHELRERGYQIDSEWKVDHTGQRYVRYWLRKKTPDVPKYVSVKGIPPCVGHAVEQPEEFPEWDKAYFKWDECKKALSNPADVVDAFTWVYTPQGDVYWDRVAYGHEDHAAAAKIIESWFKEYRRQLIEKYGPVPTSYDDRETADLVLKGEWLLASCTFYFTEVTNVHPDLWRTARDGFKVGNEGYTGTVEEARAYVKAAFTAWNWLQDYADIGTE